MYKWLTFTFLLFSIEVYGEPNDCYWMKEIQMYVEMTSEQCFNCAATTEDKLFCENIKAQKQKYSECSPLGCQKYNEDGHLYTTFSVLKAAGRSDKEIYDISYCSQLPDDNPWFSATMAFFFPNISYRNNIMGIIHSLHGGDESDVLKRRESLKKIIVEALKKKSLTNCEIGIVVHAYADSYAHTYTDKNNNLKAYGNLLGHMLHGHTPDVIAYYPEKFKSYVEELYAIFLVGRQDGTAIGELLKNVDMLPTNRRASIIQMKRYATDKYGYDVDKFTGFRENWKETVSSKDLKRLIAHIDSRL